MGTKPEVIAEPVKLAAPLIKPVATVGRIPVAPTAPTVTAPNKPSLPILLCIEPKPACISIGIILFLKVIPTSKLAATFSKLSPYRDSNKGFLNIICLLIDGNVLKILLSPDNPRIISS